MFVLDRCNIRKINTGKCIVAFGPHLFAAGSCDDFAVKDDIDPVGLSQEAKRRLSHKFVLASVISRSDGFWAPV